MSYNFVTRTSIDDLIFEFIKFIIHILGFIYLINLI